MSGIGITGGLLLGGVLVSTLGWRSVFLVNLPIGLVVLAGTRTLTESGRAGGRLDVLGAVTATTGLVALVFGVTHSGEAGVDAPVTLAALALAAVALLVFLARQRLARAPMLPLVILADRNRAGSYVATAVIGGGLMGGFYLLTLFLQNLAGYDPLRTGLAFIPFSIGIIAGSAVGSSLASRASSRLLAGAGLLVAAGGLFWLSGISQESSYLLHIAPALLLTASGLGGSFLVLTLTAVRAVLHEVVGIASSLVNTAQQVGAAIGLAALTATAVAVSAAEPDPSSSGASPPATPRRSWSRRSPPWEPRHS
ncbi:MFS transporter [Rathayibacter oskolensis]|uniref:MFS transporter n=1 Tax=Rathayibacter oskolensis TaxID=1891671 RepID=UPI00265E039E|nr:MFS transporter [Rathayibacter oskolensis]WKK70293.1 MFS transporter [Rathayibacter oskolensis]